MVAASDVLSDPSFVLGIISNLLALYLVVTKSGKGLTEYRKLLIIFLITDLAFTSIQDFLKPSFVVSGDLFMILAYSDMQSKWLLSLYAGCISISIVVFAFHFVFRALAVSSKHYFVARLGYRKLTLICTTFLAEGAIYSVVVYYTLNCEWRCDTDAMRYFTSIGFTYITDPRNQILMFRPYIPGESAFIVTLRGFGAPIALLAIAVIIIIISSVYLMRRLRDKTMRSEASRKFHRRIFHALIGQLSIPCVCIYVPAGIGIIAPFFAPPSFSTPAWPVRYLVSFYPILDPLAIILLISDYRRALLTILRIRKDKPTTKIPSLTHTTY